MSQGTVHSGEQQAGGDQLEWTYQDVGLGGEVEDIGLYRPGGLAPVIIGDKLGGRFDVTYKLGCGGIATVWLCLETATRQWKAVKLNSASHSTEDCGDLLALRLMEANGVTREQLEENHIAMALEYFWHVSPNGRHLCTVLPLLGPRADDWRYLDIKLDSDRVNKVCYQIVKGLGFLHQNGLCHNDFRPQNILMRLKPNGLNHITTQNEMWRFLGVPKTRAVLTVRGTRSIHAPEYVFTSASWTHFREFVVDEAAIVDFGEAFVPSDPPTFFGIPGRYCAPENFFQRGRPLPAGDIWSLGITLLELRLNICSADDDYLIIRNMERFVGPMPIGYRLRAKRMLEHAGWRDPNANPRGVEDYTKPLTGPVEVPLDAREEREFCSATFSDRLEMKLASQQLVWSEEPDPTDPQGIRVVPKRTCFWLPDDEVRDLADLLHKMLKYNAKDRITAAQASRHRWFRKSRGTWINMKNFRYIIAAAVSLILLLGLFWTVTAFVEGSLRIVYDPEKSRYAAPVAWIGVITTIILWK